MTFKPAIWVPIALGLAVINFVAAGFAAGASEARHVTLHVVLGAAFGVWAWWLRRRPATREPPGFEALQAEVSNLRRELSETQERLDFAERMLAQRPPHRQVGPERRE